MLVAKTQSLTHLALRRMANQHLIILTERHYRWRCSVSFCILYHSGILHDCGCVNLTSQTQKPLRINFLLHSRYKYRTGALNRGPQRTLPSMTATQLFVVPRSIPITSLASARDEPLRTSNLSHIQICRKDKRMALPETLTHRNIP